MDIQKKVDSFNKTPAGRAELAAKEKERKLIELNEKKVQEKLEKEHRKYQKVMDKLGCSEEKARDLLAGNIWIGMTIEMVVYRRGLPDVNNPSNYGDGVQYQSCWYDYSPSCFYYRSDHIVYAYN